MTLGAAIKSSSINKPSVIITGKMSPENTPDLSNGRQHLTVLFASAPLCGIACVASVFALKYGLVCKSFKSVFDVPRVPPVT